MENCRNCKWAKWSRTETGRRQFGRVADCIFLVVATIPASRASVLRDMIRPVSVREYNDMPLDCAAWEKIERE